VIPAGETAVANIPCAALSLANARSGQPFKATAESEPRLTPLLKTIAAEDNVPRETSQLAILAIIEDVDFARWLQFEAPPPRDNPAPAPIATSAQIQKAIDALGILKAAVPERRFVLESSNDLKLRALRDPMTRTKAMQIFGITTPPDLAPVAGVAPSIGQLLHTKPGDNCPVCRMRQGPPSRGNEP
jgi:hypothetical protein